ncbi:hypothetical protein EON65_22890 [archaeon]|nr:MAG: hypothetical protein EON65_22890 [archaeon]
MHISYDLLCDFLQCLATGCQNSVINQHMCMTTWEDLNNKSRNLDMSANRDKIVSMQEMINTVYHTHAGSSAQALLKYEYMLNSDASYDSRPNSSGKYVLLTLINVLLHSKYTPLLISTYALMTALVHQQPTHQHALCTTDLLDTMATHLSTYSMHLPLVSKIAMLLELLVFRSQENCSRILGHQDGCLLGLLAQYYTSDSLSLYIKHEQEVQFSSFMTHVLNVYINILENEDHSLYDELVKPDSTYLANLMHVMEIIGDKYVLLTESFVHFVSCLLKFSVIVSTDGNKELLPSATDLVLHSEEQSLSVPSCLNLLKVLHQHQLVQYLMHVFNALAAQSNHLFEYTVSCVNMILHDTSLFVLADDDSELFRDNILALDVQLVLSLAKCYIELLSKEVYTYYDHYSVFIEVYQTCHQLLCLYQVYIESAYPKSPQEAYIYDPSNSANPLDRHILYYHFPYTKALLLILTQIILKKFPVNAKYADEIVCIYSSYLGIIRLLLRDCSEVYIAVCRDINTNVVLVRNTLYLDTHITSAVAEHEKENGRKDSDLIFQAILAIVSMLYFQYSSLHTSHSNIPSSMENHYQLGNLIANLCVHFFQDKALLSVFMNHAANVFKMLVLFLENSYAYNFMHQQYVANNFHFACLLQCLQHGPASLLNTSNHPLCTLYLHLVQSLHDHLNDAKSSYAHALVTSYTYCLQGVGALCSHSVHIKVLLDDLHIEQVLLSMLVKMNALRGISNNPTSGSGQPSEEGKLADGSLSEYSPRLNAINGSSMRLAHSSSMQSRSNVKKHAKRVSFIDTESSLVIATPQEALVVISAGDGQRSPRLFRSDQLHVIMSLIIKCLSNICNEHNFVYTSSLVKGGVIKYAIQCLQAYGKESAEVTLACLELCGQLAVDNKISLGEYGMCEAISDIFCCYVPLLDVDEGYLKVDKTFALDEHLVSVLCKTIYVLCDSSVANKAKIKEYEHGKVLKVLQLLIGKYYMLITNPARADVTDALNVIKFIY